MSNLDSTVHYAIVNSSDFNMFNRDLYVLNDQTIGLKNMLEDIRERLSVITEVMDALNLKLTQNKVCVQRRDIVTYDGHILFKH